MPDPRASTALRHFALDDPPPPRWSWAVLSPEPSGRIQLPAAVATVLGIGPVRARVAGDVLVLGEPEGPGCRIGIDGRGRLYLPVWLRRPAVVVAADPGEAVVVIADAAVLDPVGEELHRAVRT